MHSPEKGPGTERRWSLGDLLARLAGEPTLPELTSSLQETLEKISAIESKLPELALKTENALSAWNKCTEETPHGKYVQNESEYNRA